MKKSALVLEGGALRCLYTTGVTDVLLENGIRFDCVVGVSSGSLCGANFLSGQAGRVAYINTTYNTDRDYISLKNRLTHGGVFNFDYLFDDSKGRWAPFDYGRYNASPVRFLVGATSCLSGQAVFFENPRNREMQNALTASSSMPIASRIIYTKKGPCLDGGIADSIPFQKALEEGYERVVVVKTQHRGYQKPQDPAPMRRLYQHAYKKYPRLLAALLERPAAYNRQLARLYAGEADGSVFILEPQSPVEVGRTEQDSEKLRALYHSAVAQTQAKLPALRAYLGGN